MKLTKILEEVMSEIGDTSNIETYRTSWETTFNSYDEKNYIVTFTTENDTKYKVNIFTRKADEEEDWTMDIEFGVQKEGGSYDFDAIVNKGEIYKVMATVVEIVKETLIMFKRKKNHIKEIIIEPSKNFEGDTRRTALYKAFIEKNMPAGSEVYVQPDMSYIKITLPKP